MRRYERSRDDGGQRHTISDDIKIAALEAIVPTELERHLQLNASRFADYKAAREEVRLFVETRIGMKLKDANVVRATASGGGGSAMDVDSFQK
eukprot:7877635-Lingulodinium_polyedra.AAC.1